MSKRKTEGSGEKSKTSQDFPRAVEALKRGEVVVFPTETLYGLGADALDPVAVERVVSLKGRDAGNPIPIIVADEEMLRDVVREVPPIAQRLIDRFWPGPLTLILPARKELPAPLLNRDGGVGVRVSSCSLATHLARGIGHPLTATSANPSGSEPARTVEEARAYFSDRLKIFLDGGRLGGKKGSTVVEVSEGSWRIIREGEIGSQELKKALTAPIS